MFTAIAWITKIISVLDLRTLLTVELLSVWSNRFVWTSSDLSSRRGTQGTGTIWPMFPQNSESLLQEPSNGICDHMSSIAPLGCLITLSKNDDEFAKPVLRHHRVEPTKGKQKLESRTPKLERGQLPLHKELPAKCEVDLNQKLFHVHWFQKSEELTIPTQSSKSIENKSAANIKNDWFAAAKLRATDYQFHSQHADKGELPPGTQVDDLKYTKQKASVGKEQKKVARWICFHLYDLRIRLWRRKLESRKIGLKISVPEWFQHCEAVFLCRSWVEKVCNSFTNYILNLADLLCGVDSWCLICNIAHLSWWIDLHVKNASISVALLLVCRCFTCIMDDWMKSMTR